jgi:hypothetical protein
MQQTTQNLPGTEFEKKAKKTISISEYLNIENKNPLLKK